MLQKPPLSDEAAPDAGFTVRSPGRGRTGSVGIAVAATHETVVLYVCVAES